jgi:hypothetical protein
MSIEDAPFSVASKANLGQHSSRSIARDGITRGDD